MALEPDRLDRREPRLVRVLLPVFEQLARRYFRLQREGTQHIEARPALYVANHNGGIAGPDLICTLATLWGRLGPDAPLYALAHDFAMRQFTPLGRLLQLVGAVRATPDNARRVIERGGMVLVYPGGDLDAYRHFRQRDEVVLGQRTGFVRIARDTGAPIIPVVAQGAHRSAIIVSDGAAIADAVGLRRWGRLSRFPVALALPWGIALGPWLPYLPLPFQIRLRVLRPVTVAAGDDLAAVREDVRARMQTALDELKARG